jgi:hypothetical protein
MRSLMLPSSPTILAIQPKPLSSHEHILAATLTSFYPVITDSLSKEGPDLGVWESPRRLVQ